MLDTVRGTANGSRGSTRSGVVFSVVVHAAVIGLVVLVSIRARGKAEHSLEPEVTFVNAAPPPPPPPPSPAGSSTPKNDRPKPVKKPDTVAIPKDPRQIPPQEDPAEDLGAVPGGVPGGVIGGVAGGVVGGVIGGVLGGTGNTLSSIPFGEGMVPPKPLESNPQIEYTREAILARVEGKAIVNCVVTVEGKLERCKLIKGLPMMNDVIMRVFPTWRYTPVLMQGRPISVTYNFPIRLTLP